MTRRWRARRYTIVAVLLLALSGLAACQNDEQGEGDARSDEVEEFRDPVVEEASARCRRAGPELEETLRLLETYEVALRRGESTRAEDARRRIDTTRHRADGELSACSSSLAVLADDAAVERPERVGDATRMTRRLREHLAVVSPMLRAEAAPDRVALVRDELAIERDRWRAALRSAGAPLAGGPDQGASARS